MNRLAVWVAQTPMALAQATASPLPEIAGVAGLDPDIAAPPLVAMDLILSLEGMARDASINAPRLQRAKIQRASPASASNALTAHPVTAANDSRIHDTKGSVPMPPRVLASIRAVGHRLSARHGQPREKIKHERESDISGSVCWLRSPRYRRRARRRPRSSNRSPTSSSSWATTSAGCSRASTIAA